MLKLKSSVVHISTLSNQPSTSARSQPVKSTLIQPPVTSMNENTPLIPPQPTESHSFSPLFTLPTKRTRTTSTSSVKTIKSYGELMKEKKRPRESLDGGGRRTRQRTASTSSTDTITCNDTGSVPQSPPSCVPFPSSTPMPADVAIPKHSSPKTQGKRNFTPPMSLLIPTRAAPSAPVVTPENVRKGAPALHPNVAPKGRPLNDTIPARFECFPESRSTMHSQSWFEIDSPTSATPPSYHNQHASISFYKRQPHFDVWDLDDDVCIGIPARVHLAAPELDEPDVRFLDIICQSYEHPFPYPYYLQAEPEYTVSFKGYHRTWTSGPETELDLTRGVVVCPRWFSGASSTRANDPERIVTSSRGVLPPDSSVSDDREVNSGWRTQGRYIKFLIPVPMSLIRAGNARVFTVEVRAGRLGVEGYGLEEVARAETEMVVSHLRSECEMGMGRKFRNGK
ncbi:hypothetical protein V5O48_010791 [Marasmius crinis-equi]|uniref:Uncharacterized protein n=1 Tax=Marasmius crinis-equi TaxID=585013 RepID=A0ABR3F7E5_9AGAR